MNAIILKEFRENAKWALLMMLALGALTVYACRQPFVPPLVGSVMHAVTSMGFAVAACIVGLVQVLQDHWRGRWAFLVHRPISRTKIFFAKLIAGLTLYLLCASIPLAAATLWIATPGNAAAPFDWRMLLPRLADLSGGLVWYLTGLLMAARNARWVGSRLFPAGFAFIASFAAASEVFTLGGALLIYAAAALVLFPAAWGAFVSGGEYESEPALIRLTQTATVAFGVLFVYAMAIAVAESFIPQPDWRNYRSYVLMNDGRALVVSNTSNGIASATDLQGNPLPRASLHDIDEHQLYFSFLNLVDFVPERLNREMELTSQGLQCDTAYARFLPPRGSIASPRWYYVISRRTIEGFDGQTGDYIGCIGPHGWTPPAQPPDGFPQPLLTEWKTEYNSLSIVASATTAYLIDMAGHQVRWLFTTTPDDRILDVTVFNLQPEAGDSKTPRYLIATRSALHLFENTTELFSVPLEHDYPAYAQVYVGQATTGQYVIQYAAGYVNGRRAGPDWLVTADAHGHILTHIPLPPLPPPLSGYPYWRQLAETAAIPPGFLMAAIIVQTKDLDVPWHVVWTELLVMSGISAALALWLLRRYDSTPSRKALWIVTCVLGGIPGVLLLICMRTPVARQPCPDCGKPRLVTRELCDHCGKPFAEPAGQGIEVLELASV